MRSSRVNQDCIESVSSIRVLLCWIVAFLLVLVFSLSVFKDGLIQRFKSTTAKYRLVEFVTRSKSAKKHIIFDWCFQLRCSLLYLFDVFELVLFQTCQNFKILCLFFLFSQFFLLTFSFIFVFLIEESHVLFGSNFIIWFFPWFDIFCEIKVHCPPWFFFSDCDFLEFQSWRNSFELNLIIWFQETMQLKQLRIIQKWVYLFSLHCLEIQLKSAKLDGKDNWHWFETHAFLYVYLWVAARTFHSLQIFRS